MRVYNEPGKFGAIKEHWPRFFEFERNEWSLDAFDVKFEILPKPELGHIVVERSEIGR